MIDTRPIEKARRSLVISSIDFGLMMVSKHDVSELEVKVRGVKWLTSDRVMRGWLIPRQRFFWSLDALVASSVA